MYQVELGLAYSVAAAPLRVAARSCSLVLAKVGENAALHFAGVRFIARCSGWSAAEWNRTGTAWILELSKWLKRMLDWSCCELGRVVGPESRVDWRKVSFREG